MRDTTEQEVLSWNGSQHFWDITFTRSPNDSEEEGILNLLSLLADLNVHVHSKGEYKVVWSLDSRGICSVKSLCENMLGSNRPNFLAKAILEIESTYECLFPYLGSIQRQGSHKGHG